MSGLILLALGCGQDGALPGLLPSELSLIIRKGDGSYASLLVPLEKNARREVDVRIAAGLRLYDGDHLWSYDLDDTGGAWSLRIADVLGDARTAFALRSDTRPTIERIERGRVWAQTSLGLVDCVIETGRCQPTNWIPEPDLHQEGPGAGFGVVMDASDAAWVRLPLDGEGASGSMLIDDVEAVVAVRWVHRILELDREDLNRSFRGRGMVESVSRDISADGDLREWGDARPLVVDARWQVDLGIDGWHGTRDGSFSVAASWAGDRLCLGARIRDDHLIAGDRLVVQIAGLPREIDLVGAMVPVNSGLEAVWFGEAVETCFENVPFRGEAVPFTVTLVDADPGESTAVLRAAPYSDDGEPLGGIFPPRVEGT